MKKKPPSFLHRFVRIGAIALLLAGGAVAGPINLVAITQWLPVTDEERNLKASPIDPEAGAEALFWRIHIVDTFQGRDPQTTFYHYLRIKIFNQRGAETQGTQDIRYSGDHLITGVAGRTIKPDGTIIELGKDAIFKRDLVKASGLKVKTVSFAMPAVEPGAIIEYRWREIRDKELANYVRLRCQRDIPVREVKYYIRPLSVPGVLLPPMTLYRFQAPPAQFVDERDGFSSVSLENVPAFKEEPMMPSEWEVQPWGLLFYAEHPNSKPEKYWPDLGRKTYGQVKTFLKVNDDVKRAADEAVAGAKDPEDKLFRLARYCRTKIKRLSDDDVTEEQRQKAKENHTPADTLKRGIGSGFDVNMLFASMAAAEGFEARVARMADRDDYPFNRGFMDDFFMQTMDIAVKVGGQWRFYDPAAKRLPVGMLRWQEEGVPALVSDPKDPQFAETPFSPAEQSAASRKGVFTLSEDGTLEGDVALTFTGHQAADRRQNGEQESAAQREEQVRDGVRKRFPGAEISDVKVENLEDAEKPLTYSYKVKVPAYAQRTGKRLFVTVDYFERGSAARFTAQDRKYPVVFPYAFVEEDHVTIRFPEGYALESPQAPPPMSLGDVGSYDVILKAGPTQLICERKLVFGHGGQLRFGVDMYPILKQGFEVIQQRDQHVLVLRQNPKVTP
jgi:hypothetical protein